MRLYSPAMVLAAALIVTLLPGPVAAAASGILAEVRFTDYSPLSANSELIRRMLSPLAGVTITDALARSGKRLEDQPVNPANEKFVVYVPAREPGPGYALLVFVPPWDAARLPEGWDTVLDEHGTIFVSAANSGNSASVLGRRAPLALLEEANVVRRYRIDPQRIFISGFSGGSRVAMRLALDYPDIFKGAILNAGSDPIGDAKTPLPSADLFHLFQESAHLVYVTGDRDVYTLSADIASMHSMGAWCVQNVEGQTENFTSHEVITPEALSRALDRLFHPSTAPDPSKLAACRSQIEGQMNAKLEQVQSLAAGGRRDAARALLQEIDSDFGGLAAPRSTELARTLDAPNNR